MGIQDGRVGIGAEETTVKRLAAVAGVLTWALPRERSPNAGGRAVDNGRCFVGRR
jgi:hypothetical protein